MMLQEKIKQSVSETFKLLWQFKWYIAFDIRQSEILKA